MRGFLMGGTSGRTTLAGEGLQHQDGHSHLLAANIPNCVAYDPTFAYEMAVIVQYGLRRMVTEREDVFYYITMMNENWRHPAMPDGTREVILKGLYLLREGGSTEKKSPRVQLLGSGSNMFKAFIADAKSLLKPGKNILSVLIRSPELAAAEAAKGLSYPVPHSVFPVTSMHRNLIRKVQCMSGWDWGPCLMTGGIYDGVSLFGIDGPRIEYLTTRSARSGELWRLSATAWLDCPAAGAVDLEARVTGTRGAPRELARAKGRFELAAGSSTATLELEVKGAEAWWPAGYGAQPLYELCLRACPAGRPGRVGQAFRPFEPLRKKP